MSLVAFQNEKESQIICQLLRLRDYFDDGWLQSLTCVTFPLELRGARTMNSCNYGHFLGHFAPTRPCNVQRRAVVLKTLSHSLSRITLGPLGEANQVLTPITSFSDRGRPARMGGREDGRNVLLSQSFTYSVLSKARKAEHYTGQIPFNGWLVAHNTQAKKHPIVSPFTA